MGVEARVVVYAASRDEGDRAAVAAYARIEQAERALSDYRLDGEPERLRAAAGGAALAASEDLLHCLGDAVRVARESGGAFDPTIGPLTRLWRRTRANRSLPAPGELAAARALVDYQQVEIDAEHSAVRLARAGMRLDFGAIGKGYAAQRAVLRLRELGFPRAFVALAGDVAAGDAPPGAAGWIVELGDGSPAPGRRLELTNCSASTSGDAVQFVEIGGARYAHEIDVRTGLGHTGPRAVTVVARDGAPADAWATAISVGGDAVLAAAERARARGDLDQIIR